MTNYTRGREIEYKVTHLLEGQGYLAQRAASSKGNWDVYAISRSGVLLVSCKRAKDLKSARSTYAAEKKKLLALAGKIPGGTRQGLYIWIDKAPGKLGGEWYAQEIITPEEAVEEAQIIDELKEVEIVREKLAELNLEFVEAREDALEAVRECHSSLKDLTSRMKTDELLKLTQDTDSKLEKIYNLTIRRKDLTDRYRELKRAADAIAEAQKLLSEQEFEGQELEPEF